MKDVLTKMLGITVGSLVSTILLFVLIGNIIGASTDEDNIMVIAIVISLQLSFLTGVLFARGNKR
ncbi:hypothetical protein B1A99_27690 [Cohnella sp. CIP 111063]|jgi:hypothetical protein|uniref:hypothetical protein n=1 Tax=unclassified Cohnella TaxID=2636738 RepID=UPI000B8BF34F|nr:MULTISPECIES: hypothetical protein [unclassified Cohnella]OXS54021.1 hypothetical protein B1A99_27690 [Cohnella sp. CIP 111063]